MCVKRAFASYHPEIYLGNKLVYFNSFLWNDEIQLPFAYSSAIVGITTQTQWMENIFITLHNVGFAVAKAVEHEWIFDIEKALAKINHLNRNGNNAFPPLYLALGYKDLRGKLHRKKFKLHFELGLTKSLIGKEKPFGELGYQTLVVTEV